MNLDHAEVIRRRSSITHKPGGHDFDTFTAICEGCGREMKWIDVRYIGNRVWCCPPDIGSVEKAMAEAI